MAHRPQNGISAELLTAASWRKSSYSGAIGNCVELAPVSGDAFAMRNSRDPHGPALVYSCAAISNLVAAVRTGTVR